MLLPHKTEKINKFDVSHSCLRFYVYFPGLVVTQINATMSGGLDVLALNEEDVTKMLAATTHLGSENVHFQVSSRGNLKIT